MLDYEFLIQHQTSNIQQHIQLFFLFSIFQ